MGEFFAELKRRRIYRIGAGYVVMAWLITQVLDAFSQLFALPDWFAQPVIIVLAVGFPVTLVGAWLIEGRMPKALVSAMGSPARFADWIIAGGLAAAVAGGLTVVVVVLSYQLFSSDDGSIASTGAAPNSIAVLPFLNLSPDPENAFFADGVHGDLLMLLSRISSLRVISRNSVMEYRESPRSSREIAEELNVSSILEGDVRREGDTLRINVQLIDAESDEYIWTESYDRQMSAENIFAIQGEMASSIADALQATLLPQEIARLNEIPTQSTAAYDFYLSGNEYFDSGSTRLDMPRAADMYAQAVAEDPGFALAWAALSRAHSYIYNISEDRTQTRLTLALEAVQRAFDLAPDLPEAHLAMGDYHYRGARDYARALVEYDAAEQGMAGSAILLESRSYIQRRLDLLEESLATMDQAIALDPRNANLHFNQGLSYLAVDFGQADRHFTRVLELSPDHSVAYIWRSRIPLFREGDAAAVKSALEMAPMNLGDWKVYLDWTAAIYERNYVAAEAVLSAWEADAFDDFNIFVPKALLFAKTYQLAGRSEDAEAAFRDAYEQLQEPLENNLDDPRIYIALGEVLAGLGEREDAVSAARRAMEIRPISLDAWEGPVYVLDSVRVFAAAGDYDSALQELERYLGAVWALWRIEGLESDPRLDPIRDDPRFVALVENFRRR